jgi:hypothetical protein
MDMHAGYWQVQMKLEDREKTAFITANGLYQFKVMPFGLTNAPSTFQRMMDVLLAGLKWNSLSILTILSFFRKLFLNIFSDWNSFSKLILTRSIKFIYSVCERDILLFL